MGNPDALVGRSAKAFLLLGGMNSLDAMRRQGKSGSNGIGGGANIIQEWLAKKWAFFDKFGEA